MKCKEEMFKDIADVKESTKFGMIIIIMKKQAVVWWSWVVGGRCRYRSVPLLWGLIFFVTCFCNLLIMMQLDLEVAFKSVEIFFSKL